MKKLLSFTAVSFICVSFAFATVQNPPKGNNSSTTDVKNVTPVDKSAKTNDFKGTTFGDISKTAAPSDTTKKVKNNTSNLEK